MLGGKHILVLGLGVSGEAAAKLAQAHGADVTVLDSSVSPRLRQRTETLREQGIAVELDWTANTWRGAADLCVVSPGIPEDSVLGNVAAGLSCPVISELEFGYRFCECPILAITGTNGKTTTVELATHILRKAGLRVEAAGNVGLPLAEVCRRSGELDFLVVEVSSFQLERIDQFQPFAAALLNVTSDHQDRYDGFAHYFRTKLRLFERMTDTGRILLNTSLMDEADVQEYPLFAMEHPLTFGTSGSYTVDDDGWLNFEGDRIMNRSELQLTGDHNVENVLAALALCRIAGVSHSRAAVHARCFKPSAHRLELVAEQGGVRFVNDSKATNPDAVVQAIETCVRTGGSGQIVLIAGGRDKDMNFEPVLPAIQAHVRAAFLLGESRDHLARIWDSVVQCTKVDSLEAAVEGAIATAAAGDTVLLSPGCASQDMFESYAERGTKFKNALKRRLGNEPVPSMGP